MQHFIGMLPLLDAALRNRATTSGQLAGITSIPQDQVERQLAELEQLGFVSIAAGQISYRRPDSAATRLSEQLIEQLTPQVQNALAQAGTALGTIPALLQAWDEGSTHEHRLQVDILHGPWAPADMWKLQFARRVPTKSDVCMPSTAALFAPQLEHQAAFWETRNGAKIDVRLLMSVADATHPLGQARIQGELDAGVRIRMHPNPPSFFWVTDDDTIGLPLIWGEAWPTSVLAIQSPALAAAFSLIYETAWNEAEAVGGEQMRPSDRVWDPMLRLMNQGLTMDAASGALGLASRTGRRRVADAMAHYRVSSQFSLGAAWADERGKST